MIDLLRTRRSIRKYATGPIEVGLIDQVLDAMLRAPSSRGRRPWHFVVVDDPLLIEQLSRAKPHGASFLTQAALCIVICGDEQASDMWVEDCSIAAFSAHLAAHSLGLGSCWIQLRLRHHDDQHSAGQYVGRLLAIPVSLRAHSMIALGYPAESKPARDASELDRTRVHRNRFA
jgi:nitroreductase